MTAGLPSPPSIPSSPPPDELARVLGETRARFVATFVTDCDAIAALLEEALVHPASDPPTELTDRVHRLIGLPGTIGFPTISRRAADLESLLAAAWLMRRWHGWHWRRCGAPSLMILRTRQPCRRRKARPPTGIKS